MVETRGVEPLTSAMPLQRSAKLSYVPIKASYEFRGAKDEFQALAALEFGFTLLQKGRDPFLFILS